MNNKNKELGKGIKALIREDISLGDDVSNAMVSIKKIIPNKKNPRKNFNKEKLEELKQSILQHGILQPLVVRKIKDDKYEVIAGGRRFEAINQLFEEHKDLRFKEIPVFIKDVNSQEEIMELALIENLQRDDLNPIEEAMAYYELKESHNMNDKEIANRIGKSRSTISNMIRLLSFNKTQEGKVIVEALKNLKVTIGQVRPLLDLNPKIQKSLFKKIQDKDMSARQVEKVVKKYKDLGVNKVQIKNQNSEDWEELVAIYIMNLSKHLETSINITKNKNGSGKITIDYRHEEELAQIIKNKILK